MKTAIIEGMQIPLSHMLTVDATKVTVGNSAWVVENNNAIAKYA